jgi:hypothetical protein
MVKNTEKTTLKLIRVLTEDNYTIFYLPSGFKGKVIEVTEDSGYNLDIKYTDDKKETL